MAQLSSLKSGLSVFPATGRGIALAQRISIADAGYGYLLCAKPAGMPRLEARNYLPLVTEQGGTSS